MTRPVSFILALALLLFAFAACGEEQNSTSPGSEAGPQASGTPSPSVSSQQPSSGEEPQGGGAVAGSPNDYEAVIRAARSDELNQISMYDPITSERTQLFENPTEELMQELMQAQRDIAQENGEEELSDEDARALAEAEIQRYLINVDYMLSTHFGDGGFSRYAISAPGVITLAYAVMIILPDEGQTDVVMAQVEAYVESQRQAMENYLVAQYEIASAALIETAPTGEILLAMCEDAPRVMDNMLAGLAE